MAENRIERLFALKSDLERLGCKVTITPGEGEDVITVRVVYPPDVPPPAPQIEDGSLQAFKAMIQRGEYLVLDTETTGLEKGEIVQIALIDGKGRTLLDELVRPVKPIPPDATRIHGIRNEDVQGARAWSEVTVELEKLLAGRDLVIYNATYDRKMMHQSAEAAGLPRVEWKELARFWDAMTPFAEIYGDWNDYRGNFRWQKLTTAAAYYNVQVVDAHSALGDCLMTLAVVKKMAESTLDDVAGQ